MPLHMKQTKKSDHYFMNYLHELTYKWQDNKVIVLYVRVKGVFIHG